MKLDRAIEVLTDARRHAEQMEKMYREDTIPARQKYLDEAIKQAVSFQEKMAQIDYLLANFEVK